MSCRTADERRCPCVESLRGWLPHPCVFAGVDALRGTQTVESTPACLAVVADLLGRKRPSCVLGPACVRAHCCVTPAWLAAFQADLSWPARLDLSVWRTRPICLSDYLSDCLSVCGLAARLPECVRIESVRACLPALTPAGCICSCDCSRPAGVRARCRSQLALQCPPTPCPLALTLCMCACLAHAWTDDVVRGGARAAAAHCRVRVW